MYYRVCIFSRVRNYRLDNKGKLCYLLVVNNRGKNEVVTEIVQKEAAQDDTQKKRSG